MSLDHELARLADRQEGVFALWQLPRSAAPGVRERARGQRLTRMHAGVYTYGHRRLTVDGHRMAAVLACGPTAVLSHASAAAAWELLATGQLRIDVTVPGTSRRSARRIRVHRTRDLPADEITKLHGVPITTVTRTLCDLAGVLPRRRLLKAVEQAERNGTLNLPALSAAIEAQPTRRGTAALRAILAEYAPAPRSRSDLERDFLFLVADAGLPPPLLNQRVADYEVDIFWPQWRLVVELDSRSYHSDPGAFERDPVRDARLQQARCRVLRVTWKRATHQASAVVADIRALAKLAEAE